MLEGMRGLARHVILRLITGRNTLFNVGRSAFMAVYLLYLVHNLRLAPSSIGVVLGFAGLGAMLGAATSRRLAELWGVGGAIVKASLLEGLSGVFVLLAGQLAPAISLLCAGELMFGFGSAVYTVNHWSLRQRIVAPDMQGRMAANMSLVQWGAAPLGALLAGTVAQHFGLEPVLLLSVAWCVISCSLFYALFPARLVSSLSSQSPPIVVS
ncbi:MAG: MFS transporter [Chloroflexota bacterium]